MIDGEHMIDLEPPTGPTREERFINSLPEGLWHGYPSHARLQRLADATIEAKARSIQARRLSDRFAKTRGKK